MQRPSLEFLVYKNALVQNIEQLKNVEGGFMKDFVRRALIAQDQPWWRKHSSEWKITDFHLWQDPEDYSPDYWQERVLDLCTYDILQTNFGLSFLDLMSLDIPTFEAIEEKVHELAKRQHDALPQDLKDRMSQSAGSSFPGMKKGL